MCFERFYSVGNENCNWWQLELVEILRRRKSSVDLEFNAASEDGSLLFCLTWEPILHGIRKMGPLLQIVREYDVDINTSARSRFFL